MDVLLLVVIVFVLIAILIALGIYSLSQIRLEYPGGGDEARTGGFEDDNEHLYEYDKEVAGDHPIGVVNDARVSQTVKWYNRELDELITETSRCPYVTAGTNRQISTIFHKGTRQDRARLSVLLAGAGIDPYDKQLYFKPDNVIYRMIRRKPSTGDQRAVHHAKVLYTAYARSMLGSSPKCKTYLDIGCMDGSITAEMGKLLGADEVHCVEPDTRVAAVPGVTISRETVKYDYKDNYFDVITAMMSLHHIPDLSAAVAEIIRVLKPGGYLIIKDHDAWYPVDCLLIDIEHRIHMVISGEIKADDTFPDDYYIQYRNYRAFDEIFSTLKYIKSHHYYPGAAYDITTTRAYWAVYQKPIIEVK